MGSEGFSKAEKNRMLLSTETLLGLRMTGVTIIKTFCMYTSVHLFYSSHTCSSQSSSCFLTAKSFIDLVQYLFSLPEAKQNNLAFLSNNICQDPLENFFGSQKQRGGTSDNPNAKEFYKNTAALRVVNSFCRSSARGICRLDSEAYPPSQKENTPLQRYRKNVNHSFYIHISFYSFFYILYFTMK